VPGTELAELLGQEANMNTGIISFASGLAAMALLDPKQGRARRARLRDRAVRAGHALERSTGVVARDLRNRSRGLVAKFHAHEPSSDVVLEERVRAKLGHVCSHPHAVVVTARDGTVDLFGAILRAEKPRVLWAVAGIEGVRGVHDELDEHETADVPELQGGGPRRSRVLHTNAPGVRFALAGAGALLLLGAISRL